MTGRNEPNTTFEDGFSEELWETTYKDHGDEDVNATLYRVAKGIAAGEETSELQEKWTDIFYEELSSQFKATMGGRIYSNAGTEWGGTTMFNCFVGPAVESNMDSLASINTHLSMQSQTLKSEGGWGENFSYLRPRGAFIEGIGVESPGAVKYMELFDVASDIITSGSGVKSTNPKAKKKIRKGAMMGVLDISHPDIVEFITAKQQAGRLSKFNISINCTDDFMEIMVQIAELKKELKGITDEQEKIAVQRKIDLVDEWDLEFPDTTHEKYDSEWDGHLINWKSKDYPTNVYKTVKASYLWDLVTESTYNRAEPGILFLDRADKLAPSNYMETIKATNPSMPAGTLVQTKTGIFPIEQLEDKDFLVKSMDGAWAAAKCFLSGTNEDLVNIEFNGMRTVSSTKQHRWPVYDKRMDRIYKVDASNLKIGDMIPKNLNELAGIEGDMSFTQDEGFLIGYFVGDGWLSKRTNASGYAAGFVFGEHELDMAQKILTILNKLKPNPSSITNKKDSPEHYIQFTDTSFIENYLLDRWGIDIDNKIIPSKLWTTNDNCIIGFVDGLLSADGYVAADVASNKRIILTTANQTLASEFSKLLSFYGVTANIRETVNKKASFPNNIDYQKEYVRYDLTIQSNDVLKFFNVFDISHQKKSARLAEMVNLLSSENNRTVGHFNFIKNITIDTSGHKVWDISVYHDQHVFPAQHGYTGNCGEQMLPPAGICCLSSINLTQMIKEDRTGFDLELVRRTTRLLTRFLDNVNNVSKTPLPEYDDSRDNKRRIGIGVIGWGSALYLLKVRFGSDAAEEIREELMKTVAQEAYMASIDLAEEKGMFKYCNPEKHAQGEFVKRLELSDEYMEKLRTTGIRNSSLLSVQPTGNTSIFANVLSGGLEPVFMHEYIRTVTVNSMPDELVGKCPKWFEGEWFETELFKNAKEGDEDILRAVMDDGTVYKIDTNRGLTKEVLCEDYGVRHMKRLGEWDANADWAATTLDLSVGDHLRDLAGFTKWIDSSCSKTINIPNDYSFEDFQNVYLDGYRTGTIKGITTYRSGTMTTVLAAADESLNDVDEEIILDDVKLPDSSPAEVKTLRAENKKLYCTVTSFPETNRPFALFVKSNYAETSLVADEAVELLHQLAIDKGIPAVHIDDQIKKMKSDNNINKVARLVSLNLRHGVLIKNVVATLDKSENAIAGSFTYAIKKLLSNYIKDGEEASGIKCNECGSESIVFESGCYLCKACGSSKCG